MIHLSFSECNTGFGLIKKINGEETCQKCPNGTFDNNNYCFVCNSGFYQHNEGSTFCNKCPIGYSSTMHIEFDNVSYMFNDSFNFNDSLFKYNNFYPNELLSTECQKCDEGQYKNDTLSCQECSTGQYQSDKGQKSCKKCIRGYREHSLCI